jgi:type I restriction enzyme, S subunit
MTRLPTGWAETTLGSIGEYLNGRGFKKSEWREAGRPIIRIQNLTGSSTSFNYFDGEPAERYTAHPGDVLVSWAATLGVFVWNGPEAVINQHIFKVRSFIDPRFHRYLLLSVLNELERQTHGSGMVHITKGLFDNTPVRVPPLAEQPRVVAAIEEQFSRLDAAEALLRSALDRLASLRISAVVAAYASDWPWTTLGDIAEIAGGVTKDAKRQSDPSFVEVPYLRVANVQRGYLDLAEVTTIRVSPEKAKNLALEPGDVLFNEGGDRDKLGRGWVWSGEIAHCIHQNHVFRARLKEGFDPRFVSWHGNGFGQRWFNTYGRQTTNLASLNLTTLKSFPVPAPSLSDQRRAVAEIERRLSIIDVTANALRTALVQAGALRRAVLDSAFSGQLAAHEPTDEPAVALLDRIASERASSDVKRRTTTRHRRRKATA